MSITGSDWANDFVGASINLALDGAIKVLVYGYDKIGPDIGTLYHRSSREKGATVAVGEVQYDYRIDEIFVVLARLGERLLALGVFDLPILETARVQFVTELTSGGYIEIRDELLRLEPSLQYLISGAMYFCAACHPMHVYRGFGAGVWDNWAWACADPQVLPKPKKHLFKKADPVREITRLPEFDEIIALLKSHAVRDSVLTDYPKGISRTSPDYTEIDEKNKDYRENLKLLEDFSKTLDKRGFPVPKDGSLAHVARFAIPHSTWRSSFASKDQKDHSWADVISQQMDPGKILYAFTAERRLDLPDDEVLVLPPATPAEQLAIWLEGKAGTSHRILRWDELNTEVVEKHFGRATKKYVGRDPLPNRFAFSNLNPTSPRNALYRFQSMSISSPVTSPGAQSQPALPMLQGPRDAASPGIEPNASGYFTGGPSGTASPLAGAAHPIYRQAGAFGSPLTSPVSTHGATTPSGVDSRIQNDAVVAEDGNAESRPEPLALEAAPPDTESTADLSSTRVNAE